MCSTSWVASASTHTLILSVYLYRENHMRHFFLFPSRSSYRLAGKMNLPLPPPPPPTSNTFSCFVIPTFLALFSNRQPIVSFSSSSILLCPRSSQYSQLPPIPAAVQPSPLRLYLHTYTYIPVYEIISRIVVRITYPRCRTMRVVALNLNVCQILNKRV